MDRSEHAFDSMLGERTDTAANGSNEGDATLPPRSGIADRPPALWTALDNLWKTRPIDVHSLCEHLWIASPMGRRYCCELR